MKSEKRYAVFSSPQLYFARFVFYYMENDAPESTTLLLVNSWSGSRCTAASSCSRSCAATGKRASWCLRGAGWWRTPTHSTPETLWLTEPTPHPMLGISGLLNLLTWVEYRQLAQASQHEEGGVPCPVPYPTRLPPTRFQASNQSMVGSAPGQSSATSQAAESPARTPAGTEQHTKQGGRR